MCNTKTTFRLSKEFYEAVNTKYRLRTRYKLHTADCIFKNENTVFFSKFNLKTRTVFNLILWRNGPFKIV